MKKAVSCTLMTLLLLSALLPAASANSAPTYWEGAPATEILAVEENCPITVSAETLTFDAEEEQAGYSLTARVTAVYRMENPTAGPLPVQMAFSLEEAPARFNPETVSITADGAQLPFRLCFGDTVYQDYLPTAFDPEGAGTVYTFTSKPSQDNEAKVSIRFQPGADERIFADGVSSYALSDDGTVELTMRNWAQERITLFVFGGGLDYEAGGDYTVDTQDVPFSQYFQGYLEALPYADHYRNHWDDLLALKHLGLNQLWTEGGLVCSEWLEQYSNTRQSATLLYTVEFPAGGGREVAVSYNANATGDRRGTEDWTQTFTYLLSPARHWADFGTLDLAVHTTQAYPYVVDASLPLEQTADGVYTAHLDGLPEGELTFTLYPKAEITALDRLSARARILPYLIAFLPVLALPVAVIALVVVIRRGIREDKKRP